MRCLLAERGQAADPARPKSRPHQHGPDDVDGRGTPLIRARLPPGAGIERRRLRYRPPPFDVHTEAPPEERWGLRLGLAGSWFGLRKRSSILPGLWRPGPAIKTSCLSSLQLSKGDYTPTDCPADSAVACPANSYVRRWLILRRSGPGLPPFRRLGRRGPGWWRPQRMTNGLVLCDLPLSQILKLKLYSL